MGRRKIKPVFTEDELGKNPLAGIDFKVIIRKITEKGKYRLDGETMVPVEIELEHEDYVKVYTTPENRKLIAALDDCSKKLLFWVMYKVEHGKDYLWVNRKECMKEIGIKSVNTFKKGMASLVRYNILYISLIPDVYWINPRLFFAGSRINKYPDHVEEYMPKK